MLLVTLNIVTALPYRITQMVATFPESSTVASTTRKTQVPLYNSVQHYRKTRASTGEVLAPIVTNARPSKGVKNINTDGDQRVLPPTVANQCSATAA